MPSLGNHWLQAGKGSEHLLALPGDFIKEGKICRIIQFWSGNQLFRHVVALPFENGTGKKVGDKNDFR